MDQRLEELKILKRLYRSQKRRATALWKALCAAACVLAAPVAPLCLGQIFPNCNLLQRVIFLERQAVWYLGIQASGFLSRYGIDIWIYLGACGAVFLLAVCLWICARSRAKKADVYLSYRTLKSALKEEKKYRKEKN